MPLIEHDCRVFAWVKMAKRVCVCWEEGTVFTFSLKGFGICFRNKGKGKALKLSLLRGVQLCTL